MLFSALVLFCGIVTVDALRRPASAFRVMGHRKVLWMLPGALAAASFAVSWWWVPLAIGVALAGWYLAKVRDLVKVAAGVQRRR